MHANAQPGTRGMGLLKQAWLSRLSFTHPTLTARNPQSRLVDRRGEIPAGSLCNAAKLWCRSKKRKIRTGAEENAFQTRKKCQWFRASGGS